MNKTNTTLLGLLGAGVITLGSGCANLQRSAYNLENTGRDIYRMVNAEPYSPRALNEMSENQFGDKDFNTEISVTKINGTEYVWVPIGNREFTVDGLEVNEEEYFPLAALERDKLTELVNPSMGTVTYSYSDSGLIVFEKDESIRRLRETNIPMNSREMPRHRRVKNVKESRFEVPLINYGLPGLGRVAYSGSPEGLILMVNPRYGLNHGTNSVDLYDNGGNSYIEREATLEIPFDKTNPVSGKDIVDAVIERETIE